MLRLIHNYVVYGGLISEAIFNLELTNVQKTYPQLFYLKRKKMRDSAFAHSYEDQNRNNFRR